MNNRTLFGLGPDPRRAQLKRFSKEEWMRINRGLERLHAEEEVKKLHEKKKRSPCLPPSIENNPFKKENTTVTDRNEDALMKTFEDRKSKVDPSKEDIIRRAKTILFENKDYSRILISGLNLSSILHERNNQIEFNRFLRKENNKKEMEIRKRLKEEISEIDRDIKDVRLREREKLEAFRKGLEMQIRMQREEAERFEKLEKDHEKAFLMKLEEELREMSRKEKSEIRARKAKLRAEIDAYTKSEMEIRRKEKAKEAEEEEINDIYRKVGWDLDEIRRDKEKKIRTRTLECIQVPERETVDEEELLKKQRKDKDEQLKKFLAARENRKVELLKDLLAGKLMAKKDQECRKTAEESERRACVSKRLRKLEADKIWMMRKNEAERKRKREMMLYHMKQWTEKKEAESKEKQMDRLYNFDFSTEDKAIEKLCTDVLQMVKRQNRPFHPVNLAVKELKKEFGLYEKKNLNVLRSNVPIGTKRQQ